MPYTKAYMLRSSIAFILRGVRVQFGRRFPKLGLTEEQRYEVADQVVAKLREEGWKELDDLTPDKSPGPGWLDGLPPCRSESCPLLKK